MQASDIITPCGKRNVEVRAERNKGGSGQERAWPDNLRRSPDQQGRHKKLRAFVQESLQHDELFSCHVLILRHADVSAKR
jgi:hypothetical protein